MVIQAETAVTGKSHTKDFGVKAHTKVVGVRNRIINSEMSPSLFQESNLQLVEVFHHLCHRGDEAITIRIFQWIHSW